MDMSRNVVSRSYHFIEEEGMAAFLRTAEDVAARQLALLYTLPVADALCYRYSRTRLRARMRGEHGLEDVLDTVYQFSGAGAYGTLAPLQLRSELAAVTEYIADREPTTVVEIGTKYGGTFYTWSRYLDTATTLVSLDVPGGTTPPRLLQHAAPGKRLEFVRGNSHEAATREELERALDGAEIDVLFIDGDHTLDGVREDWETYRSLVSEGGVVLFHDIVSIDRDEQTQVDVFWDRLASRYDTLELVDDSYDPHDPVTVAGHPIVGHGFGIVLNPRD
jgi:cephalosporin hydroxylase